MLVAAAGEGGALLTDGGAVDDRFCAVEFGGHHNGMLHSIGLEFGYSPQLVLSQANWFIFY